MNNPLSTPIDELMVSDVHTTPINVEGWDTASGDEAWNFYEAVRVDTHGTTVTVVVDRYDVVAAVDESEYIVYVNADDNTEHYLEEHTDENGDPVEDSLPEQIVRTLDELSDAVDEAAGPGMNYWYPVDHISDVTEAIAAAYAIRDLGLVVVEVDGAFGLALAGGGMDMSWDIVAAYVTLGTLPPIHFSDLPNMGSSQSHPVRQYVFTAMLRSLDIASAQALTAADRLAAKFPEYTGPFVLGVSTRDLRVSPNLRSRQVAAAEAALREQDPDEGNWPTGDQVESIIAAALAVDDSDA